MAITAGKFVKGKQEAEAVSEVKSAAPKSVTAGRFIVVGKKPLDPVVIPKQADPRYSSVKPPERLVKRIERSIDEQPVGLEHLLVKKSKYVTDLISTPLSNTDK